MDMHKHRRERLHQLISSPRFNNDRKAFCAEAKMSESRLAQLLSQTFRDGQSFGEKMARKIEAELNLPELYFDQNYLIDNEMPRIDRVRNKQRIFSTAEGENYHLTAAVNIHKGPFSHLDVRKDAMFSLFGSAASINAIQIAYAGDDTMAPTIPPGDLIFYDMTYDEVKEDGIYLFFYGGPHIHIKRLQRIGGKIVVSCDNAKYSSWEIDTSLPNEEKEMPERFTLMGKVVKTMTFDVRTPA